MYCTQKDARLILMPSSSYQIARKTLNVPSTERFQLFFLLDGICVSLTDDDAYEEAIVAAMDTHAHTDGSRKNGSRPMSKRHPVTLYLGFEIGMSLNMKRASVGASRVGFRIYRPSHKPKYLSTLPPQHSSPILQRFGYVSPEYADITAHGKQVIPLL